MPDLARGLHGEQRAQMHQSLTEFSAEMIRACDRLSLVCDVAHATEDPCTGPWPWVGAPQDRFVVDSALEGTGFEPSVPREAAGILVISVLVRADFSACRESSK